MCGPGWDILHTAARGSVSNSSQNKFRSHPHSTPSPPHALFLTAPDSPLLHNRVQISPPRAVPFAVRLPDTLLSPLFPPAPAPGLGYCVPSFLYRTRCFVTRWHLCDTWLASLWPTRPAALCGWGPDCQSPRRSSTVHILSAQKYTGVKK